MIISVSASAFDFSKGLFVGLWESTPNYYRTSAPGAKLSFLISEGTLKLEMSGSSYWQVLVNGKLEKKFLVSEKSFYPIVESLPLGKHLVEIVHASESLPGETFVYGFDLSKSATLFSQTPPKRKIEFIGDSYTVGYGVEALSPEDGTVEETTNTTKSYAFLIAEKLKADYRISAFSGRGLVRNYGGIEPDWTIPKLLQYTVPGMAANGNGGSLRDFSSWTPSVVVIFVGINDFQGEAPTPSEADFIKSYRVLIGMYRKKCPGVQFLLLATKVWPKDLLIPAVEKVYNQEIQDGFKDLEFKIVYTENTALHGHPSAKSQEELARILLNDVARLGKFLSR